MDEKINRVEKRYFALAIILAAIIFQLDIQFPLGVAGGVPYVVPVLVSLLSGKKGFTIFTTVFCSALTVAGYFLSPEGSARWIVLTNRFLALFVIWMTALIGLEMKRCEMETHEAKERAESLIEELRLLSSQDSLTGVANRRRFDEFIEDEWRRAKRDKFPVSLLMFDIDHFKLYNDSLGHQEGDNCLVKVAGEARRYVRRPGDLMARYGGEEFVVVLSDTVMETAMELAERLREGIEALRMKHPRSDVSDVVTVSVGVSSMTPGSGRSAPELVKAADMALYVAKKAGRNKVAVYDGLPHA